MLCSLYLDIVWHPLNTKQATYGTDVRLKMLLPIVAPAQVSNGIRLPHYTANPILSLNSGLYGQPASGRTPTNQPEADRLSTSQHLSINYENPYDYHLVLQMALEL